MRRGPISILFLFVASVAACAYRPAMFKDQVPVTRVLDDNPIPMPARTPHVEMLFINDLYLRRPVVDALDPQRFPRALDANAMDEVPSSSWFWPLSLDSSKFFAQYAADGAPVPPSTVKGRELTDSRGKKYQLSADPPDSPATTTAAAVIASRLLRAVGYRTPEVWLVSQSGKRHSAARWPLGVTLGPTDMTSQRGDDPNDRIEHRDRRTLRALSVFAAWLDLRVLGPSRVVDVYVGRPGAGHVQHFVVGLGDALGAGSLQPPGPLDEPGGAVRGNGFKNLITLGLARPEPHRPTIRSLLLLSPEGADTFSLGKPWEPVDRLLPADGYWAAKRLLRIPPSIIREAIRTADLPEEGVASHVERALDVRRKILARSWFERVTPCEVIGLEGVTLVLRDEAVAWDFESADSTRYVLRFLNERGEEIADAKLRRGKGDELRIAIPENALDHDYVVASVTAVRKGVAAPRSCEAHMVVKSRSPHVVGLRH